TTKQWDWGFLFENGYGTDDSYTHSSGLLDNRPPNDPQNQYDILQADVTLEVPGGATITAGKFVGLLGEEVINPTGDAFYSHSYSFTYGVASTDTGVLASYTWAKGPGGNPMTLTGGITRGWNQSLRDGNGAIDGIVELTVQPTSAFKTVFNAQVGPEGNSPAHVHVGPFTANGKADNSDYWTTLEAIPSYTVSDQLTVSADCLYSDAPHDSYAQLGQSAQWYGVAAYASYKIGDSGMFTANLRGEWYRDQGGATIEGISANYYEATAGVDIKPFPSDNYLQWLQIRPEVREDWSDRPVFNFSHNGGVGDYQEFSVACDVLMQF
ncbi:MAG TPA: outer membrane beta-barrel protein, partial [Tepidisphaeraceae bacterium]|nr:outer membrane beta-barrel protein [Tepidisphaeraceae bacterium]